VFEDVNSQMSNILEA